MVVRFFLTPYTLHKLGNDRYGVWAIAAVLTGYFGLLDFGLARSFDKYLAEYYAKRDYQSFNLVVNIGLLFYVAFSVLIVAIMMVFCDPLMELLGISSDRVAPDIVREGAFAFIGAVVIFGWGVTSTVFGMILTGLQRMDVINKIGISMSILGVIGTVIALELGYGLRGLIVSTGVVAVIGTVITTIAAYKLFPHLRINPFMTDRRMFRQMFSFGMKLQVAKLANLISFQLDRPLISRFMHVSLVTPYSFGAGFIASVRQVILMLPSAVIPATSELEARNNRERSYEFYERGTRYLVLFGTPVCVFAIVAAFLIIRAWLGAGYEMADRASRVIQILTVGYYANMSTGVATGVAVGMGKPEYEMKFGVLLTILSLVLSIGLVTTVGFYGPAIASTVSLTVCALYFYVLFHNYLGRPLGEFLRRLYGLPVLASGLAAGVTCAVQYWLVRMIIPSSRPVALAILCAEGLLFFGLYAVIIFYTRYLDTYDRQLMQRYLARLGIR